MLVRFLWRRGRSADAHSVALELRDLANGHGSTQLQSLAAGALAMTAREQGDASAAASWQQLSCRLNETQEQLGCDLSSRGNDALLAGDLELAAELFQAALTWETCHGSPAGQAADWGSLGLVHLLAGRPRHARDCFRAALPLHRQSRDFVGLAQDWLHLGQAAAAEHRFQRADRCFARALRLAIKSRHARLQQDVARARTEAHRMNRLLSTDPLTN